MRQVPQKNNYLLVGSGRLAHHLKQYFLLLDVPIIQWSRNNNPHFNTFNDILDTQERWDLCLKNCTHVLLAISDLSIPKFAESLANSKTVLHFSGSLVTPLAIGVHPLMTFSTQLYDLDFYKKIPFVLEENKFASSLSDYIPEWQNPNYIISKSKKGLYHALCVFSGNFSNLLWKKTYQLFEQEFQLPKEVLDPYLTSNFQNIISDPFNSLTGPLTRNDSDTLQSNEKALQAYQLNTLYHEFVRLYQREV